MQVFWDELSGSFYYGRAFELLNFAVRHFVIVEREGAMSNTFLKLSRSCGSRGSVICRFGLSRVALSPPGCFGLSWLAVSILSPGATAVLHNPVCVLFWKFNTDSFSFIQSPFDILPDPSWVVFNATVFLVLGTGLMAWMDIFAIFGTQVELVTQLLRTTSSTRDSQVGVRPWWGPAEFEL